MIKLLGKGKGKGKGRGGVGVALLRNPSSPSRRSNNVPGCVMLWTLVLALTVYF